MFTERVCKYFKKEITGFRGSWFKLNNRDHTETENMKLCKNGENSLQENSQWTYK